MNLQAKRPERAGRRFLVPETSRRPNLASQCLGLALRELSAQWLSKHDLPPALGREFQRRRTSTTGLML